MICNGYFEIQACWDRKAPWITTKRTQLEAEHKDLFMPFEESVEKVKPKQF
jgi:hypothetical protein